MRVRTQTSLGSGFAAAAMAVFALLGYGCNSDETKLDATFISSVTPITERLVKISSL